MAGKTTWYRFFLGVRQQHTNAMYSYVDDILYNNPQIEKFVEIGTGGGAFSVILGLHAVQRGSHLLTYDIQIRGHKPKVDSVFDKLGVEFVEEDVFENVKNIQKHMDGKPTFFFCDGGDKRKELEVFAPLLPSGSVIAVHDYGDEILPEDVRKHTVGWTPILEDFWTDTTVELYTCFLLKP